MDGADTRREVPTANAKWGNALCVLLGDASSPTPSRSPPISTTSTICRKSAAPPREVCCGRNHPDPAPLRPHPHHGGVFPHHRDEDRRPLRRPPPNSAPVSTGSRTPSPGPAQLRPETRHRLPDLRRLPRPRRRRGNRRQNPRAPTSSRASSPCPSSISWKTATETQRTKLNKLILTGSRSTSPSSPASPTTRAPSSAPWTPPSTFSSQARDDLVVLPASELPRGPRPDHRLPRRPAEQMPRRRVTGLASRERGRLARARREFTSVRTGETPALPSPNVVWASSPQPTTPFQ